jgi:hypothetical protein
LHKLAICDIRVSLELASKASSLFVLSDWINESALRRASLSVEDPETKTQTRLIPDAAFTLWSHTGRKADFFLEMDMETVSLKHIRERVRGYLLRQDPSPVLFVVPDSSRQMAIAQVALEEAKALKANPTRIWITLREYLTQATILAAPWVAVGHTTPVTFQGLAEPITNTRTAVFAENRRQLG